MKNLFFALLITAVCYGQSYIQTIHLKDGSTKTFYVDNIQRMDFTDITSIKSSDALNTAVNEFRIFQNFPNPFNPSTTISYQVPDAARVKVSVYDINGKLVKILFNGVQREGNHQVVWNGTNRQDKIVASGIYIYRVESNKSVLSKQMILLK